MNQNKITLALLLSGSMAAPGPALVEDTRLPGTNNPTNLMYVWDGVQAITDAQGARDIVEEDSKTTGLYGCIRSGHFGLVPQEITGASGDTLTVVPYDSNTTQGKVFYQESDAENGKAPIYVAEADVYPTTADHNSLPWVAIGGTPGSETYNEPAPTSTGTGTVTAKASMAAYKSRTVECCQAYANGATVDITTGNTCLTFIPLQEHSTNTGDMQIGTDGDSSTAVPIPNRFGVYREGNTSDGTTGGGVLLAEATYFKNNELDGQGSAITAFDKDFVLGALGQRSEDTSASPAQGVNWCTGGMKKETSSSTAEISALHGFNKKTKCTWQLQSSDKDNAPQFKLKAATNSDFVIQWIETNADGTMTTNQLMSTTLDAVMGTYGSDVIYFNPIISGWKSASDDLFVDMNAAATKFTDVSGLDNFPGSPGNANYFRAAGDEHIQLSMPSNLGFFMIAYEVAQSVYDGYVQQVDTFNDDVKTYNADLKAWQDAVAKDAAQTSVKKPEIVCPPKAPVVDLDLEILSSTTSLTVSDQATDVEATDYEGKDVIYYSPVNAAADPAINDSRRYSYVYPDLVQPSPLAGDGTDFNGAYVETGNHAGHVYGRLGQGEWAMPGKSAPWALDQSVSTKNYMNVSVFPDINFTTIDSASNHELTLEISEAAFAAKPLTAPTPPSVTFDDLDDKAIAMGVSMAALAAVMTLY